MACPFLSSFFPFCLCCCCCCFFFFCRLSFSLKYSFFRSLVCCVFFVSFVRSFFRSFFIRLFWYYLSFSLPNIKLISPCVFPLPSHHRTCYCLFGCLSFRVRALFFFFFNSQVRYVQRSIPHFFSVRYSAFFRLSIFFVRVDVFLLRFLFSLLFSRECCASFSFSVLFCELKTIFTFICKYFFVWANQRQYHSTHIYGRIAIAIAMTGCYETCYVLNCVRAELSWVERAHGSLSFLRDVLSCFHSPI